jgi:hypothetical protein
MPGTVIKTKIIQQASKASPVIRDEGSSVPKLGSMASTYILAGSMIPEMQQ